MTAHSDEALAPVPAASLLAPSSFSGIATLVTLQLRCVPSGPLESFADVLCGLLYGFCTASTLGLWL